jgi:signal transduction histidine kinase/DNA-binding response OmpR family regulator
MYSFKKRSTYLFLVYLVLLLAACTPKQAEKKFRIGFSQCTMVNKFRQTMLKEMERELSFHPQINFIFKDANGSTARQIEQIQELIDQKSDIIIISPNEAAPISPIVDKAFAAGIKIIIVDRRTTSANYTAYVGASNYEVGKNAAIFTNAAFKGTVKILEVSDIPGSSADIDRHKGFTEFLNHHPSLEYRGKVYEEGDENPSGEKLTQFLQSDSNINLIFAQNDRLAFSAYKVCKKMGLDKKIKIIGVDGLPDENGGIDLVDKKILAATILYPTGGEEAIVTALKVATNNPYQKENLLVTTIIDSTNVRITKLQNEKVLAQQMDIDRRQKKIEEQITITQSQTNIILTISITLAMALVMGIVLFYYLTENKKINARLSLQNEEIIMQRNQLIELGNKAKAATDAKFNFFTNISHELRTPLTLILGPLEEVLLSPKLHFPIKIQLEMVKKNSMRLLRLVNQLMDFRKIEEGKMKLRACENNIITFVADITNAFTELAAAKKITYRLDTKEKDLAVWFDVNMLDKVLFNLLSNAFKYTGEHGFISVVVNKDGTNKNTIIKIEDSGIGMNTEAIEHAFDIFYQGNDGRYKGTGLGLALSRELITLHHGTIAVKSKNGEGTSFEVTLPLGNDHLDENEMVTETFNYNVNYEDSKIYLNEAEIFQQLFLEEKSIAGKEISILIIEDNPEVRMFLKNQLCKSYEILEAENGNMGLHLAYEIVPDLIISDIMLPGKDGMMITETLKNDIRTSHIPIIILTAKGSIEQQIEGLKMNADAYIVKPFNIQYLEESIKNLLRKRETLKGRYSSELPNESQRNAVSKKIDRKFVNDFFAIIENNISNQDFSVNEICKELGISRVQLYRKVKAVLGYNINEYILDVRMQKAKYLLLNEDHTIAEVSDKVGFSSQAYFATVFKSKFGLTPKAFKENKSKF